MDKGPKAGKNEQLRLQVYLARSGVASRRKSESIIAAGRVTVNGKRVTAMGTVVSRGDEVRVDDVPIEIERSSRYLAMHKPREVISAVSDPRGRTVVCDLLGGDVQERVYPVGRLDYWSTGLILLTNDGEFAKVIFHPSYEIEKEYLVETTEALPEKVLKDFVSGITIEGERYSALRYQRTGKRTANIVLNEGKNREIRRVLEAAELKVRRVHRSRIGVVSIGTLKPGAYRALTKSEVAWFKQHRREEAEA
jgi:23S rRNA pseudouridine2605 synthase